MFLGSARLECQEFRKKRLTTSAMGTVRLRGLGEHSCALEATHTGAAHNCTKFESCFASARTAEKCRTPTVCSTAIHTCNMYDNHVR